MVIGNQLSETLLHRNIEYISLFLSSLKMYTALIRATMKWGLQ